MKLRPQIPPDHSCPLVFRSDEGSFRTSKRGVRNKKIFTPDLLFAKLERDHENSQVDREWLRRVKVRLNELKRINREFGRIGTAKRKDLKIFVAGLVDITYSTKSFSEVRDGRLVTTLKRIENSRPKKES